MSPRAYLVVRVTKSGKRWHVRYKPRGASTPVHWGSYTSKGLAERARDYVNGELAVGRYPSPRDIAPPPPRLTAVAAFDAWVTSHPSPTAGQSKQHRQARAALEGKGRLGRIHVDRVGVTDVQEWVNALAEEYSPATVRQYLARVKSSLVDADADVRWDRLRLPLEDDDNDVNPPSWEAFQAIADAILPRHRVVLEFMEGHGLRSREVDALLVGDLDLAGRRIRIARSRTKGRTGGQRFVPLAGVWAEYLHHHHLPPLEDRDPAARAFPAFNANTFRGALARACQTAGVGHYPPHQLRHRYISLLMLAGVDVALVGKIAGHRQLSTTQDVYTHVLVGEPLWRLEVLRQGVSWVSGLVAAPDLARVPPAISDLRDGVGSTGIVPSGPSDAA